MSLVCLEVSTLFCAGGRSIGGDGGADDTFLGVFFVSTGFGDGARGGVGIRTGPLLGGGMYPRHGGLFTLAMSVFAQVNEQSRAR